MTNYIFRICLVLVCLFTLVGCEEDPTEATIIGNTYTNKYFEFSFKIPEDWIVMDKRTTDIALQRQMEAVAWSQGVSENTVRSAAEKTYHLLSIFEKPVDSDASLRSSITIGAVKMSPRSESGSSSDFLVQMIKVMRRGAIAYKPLGEVTECFIGGRQFSKLDLSILVQSAEVHQAYVLGKVKGYALLFIFTGDSKEGVNRSVKIAKPVHFKR
ncbi:MAG: hypothetical protein ABIF87_07860 [Pseudomonadota bacterium]